MSRWHILLLVGFVPWLFVLTVCSSPAHAPFRDTSYLKDIPPKLHADEAVQWSLAKDSEAGISYSDNQDKFHGPALAVAAKAVLAVRSVSFDDATQADLQLVPFLFYLLICAAPLCLRGVSKTGRFLAFTLLLLSSAGCYFGHYFIQEPLLVAGFVWGVLLWLQSAGGERPAWWALFSGAAFGLSLACKVTAAAYLGILLLALLIFDRETLSWRRVGWATLGAVFIWVSLQTVLFTDWAGMVAWGHQFWRSFAVASGNDDTLTLTNPGYWWTVGLWLAALVGIRLIRGGPRSADDVPLALAVGCFLFHLALPYKTPWLLFLPVCLSLAMVWPVLAEGRVWTWAACFAGANLFVLASCEILQRHSATHSQLYQRLDEIAEIRAAWEKQYPSRPFYIAVEGGHYWPLPYYLRKYQVGYGEFAGSEKAAIRFLPALNRPEPKVPGYANYFIHLRSDEPYWMLVDASVAPK
jgi:hypothetical protein